MRSTQRFFIPQELNSNALFTQTKSFSFHFYSFINHVCGLERIWFYAKTGTDKIIQASQGKIGDNGGTGYVWRMSQMGIDTRSHGISANGGGFLRIPFR